TTAPLVTLTSPATGSSTNTTTPTFSGAAGTALDDSYFVHVKVYSGSTATGTPVQNLTAAANGNPWTAEAASLPNGTNTAPADQATNVGFSAAVTFTVDTAAPTVTLTSPANGGSTNDTTPTLSGAAGTAAGDLATVTVKLYSGNTATGTPLQTLMAPVINSAWTVDATALPQGTYTAPAAQANP